MKRDEWIITIKMNSLRVLKVEIKTRNQKAEAVNIPVLHGLPFTIPIQTEYGEINFLMEIRGDLTKYNKGKDDNGNIC